MVSVLLMSFDSDSDEEMDSDARVTVRPVLRVVVTGGVNRRDAVLLRENVRDMVRSADSVSVGADRLADRSLDGEVDFDPSPVNEAERELDMSFESLRVADRSFVSEVDTVDEFEMLSAADGDIASLNRVAVSCIDSDRVSFADRVRDLFALMDSVANVTDPEPVFETSLERVRLSVCSRVNRDLDGVHVRLCDAEIDIERVDE